MEKLSLDQKILSLALNDSKFAMAVTESTKHSYYNPDMQWLFVTLKHYFGDPNIRALPSRDMVEEHVAGSANSSKFLDTFDAIKSAQVDPNEFKWLLEKIKFRYNDRVQAEIADKIEELRSKNVLSKERIDELNKELKKSVAEIDSIHRKETYREGSLRDRAVERAKRYNYIESHPEAARGILSGFSTFDQITNGLHAGEFMIIAGDTGCQPSGSKVMMSNGKWKNVEEVVVGDVIMSPQRDGSVVPNKVTKTFVFDNRDVYIVKSKGKRKSISYRASHNHILPIIRYRNVSSKYAGPRLYEMSIDDFNKKSDAWKNKCKLFTTPAFELPTKDFKLDPYIVGCMLGDGSTKGHPSFTSANEELFAEFDRLNISMGRPQYKVCNKAYSRYITGDSAKLMRSVLGRKTAAYKEVPEEYLCGSIHQRLELLAGLIDTDGTHEEFSTKSEKLADNFKHLVCSVGGVATIKERYTSYNGGKTKFKSFRVHYSFTEYTPNNRLEYKKHTNRNMDWKNPRNRALEVELESNETVYGFSLDGESQWYITDDFIVTHNTGKSVLMHNYAVNAYLGKNTLATLPEDWDDSGKNILYFTLEMPQDAQERRIDSCIGEIYANHIRDGLLDEEGKKKYFRTLEFQSKYPKHFYIVDMPKQVTPREIELKYLEVFESGLKPDLVVIDYMGIMSPNNPSGSDWMDLGIISAELHEFARVHEVAVLTGSQVNRPKDGTERYDTNRIARSSMVPNNANVIIQIAKRDDEELRTDMLVYITKMRDGEKKQFTLSKDLGRMRVIDIVDDTYADNSEGDDDNDIV